MTTKKIKFQIDREPFSHAHFVGIFSTARILKIVDLGMKEYNQCFKSVLLNEFSQHLKTLGRWEMPDWRLQGVAKSRDPGHLNQRS